MVFICILIMVNYMNHVLNLLPAAGREACPVSGCSISHQRERHNMLAIEPAAG